MLQHTLILPIAVAKRTSLNCSSVTIQHLLSFSSIITPNTNVDISKYKNTSQKVSKEDNTSTAISAYKYIKATVLKNLKVDQDDAIDQHVFTNSNMQFADRKKFQKIEFLLNQFQQALNNGDMTITDLPKDENFKILINAIKDSNNVIINTVMKKLNMNKINNLLVEDLISKELVRAVLNEFDQNDSILLLMKLASGRCRATPILTTLAENITKYENTKLTCKTSSDILYSMVLLSFYNKNLINYLMTNLIEIIQANKDITDLQKLLKSLSILRIRNETVLNLISVWILENRENIKSDDVCSLLMTFAVLGYVPTNFNDIFEQLITPIIQSKSLTTFELLDMVWALTVLEKATAEHAEMILNYDFLNNDHLCVQPSKIIKILNINAAASVSIPNYTGPILPENSLFFKPDIILSKERIKISNPIIKALKLLLPANNTYMNSYNNTNMGFIIDAEFCVDNNCTPFPINLTLSEEINRVAVLSVTFSEMCYELTEVMGKIKFYSKLLEKKGYKVLLLPYKEEQSKQSLISRAKFINEKLKQLLEK